MPRLGRTRNSVRLSRFRALALTLALAGCSKGVTAGAPVAPKLVADSSLTTSLLKVDELNQIMGTSGMTPQNPVTQMSDHRNLLPNMNCLGVWQVNESSIYESSHWKSVRQQMVRDPNVDLWNFVVVQSIVSYRTADGAREFFTESTDRWSKCTNHTLNIQLNGQPLPKWVSGGLTKTDDLLAIPYTRGTGDQARSCQHALSIVSNLILDIQACKPQQQAAVTQAVAIADKIKSKLPT